MPTKKQSSSMQGYSHYNPHGSQQDGVSYSMLQSTTNLPATPSPAPANNFVQPPNAQNVRQYGVSNTQPTQSLPPSQGPTPTSTPPALPIDPTNNIKQMSYALQPRPAGAYNNCYQTPPNMYYQGQTGNRNAPRMIRPHVVSQGYYMHHPGFYPPGLYPVQQPSLLATGQLPHSYTYTPNQVPAQRPTGPLTRTTTPSITTPPPANTWQMSQPQQVQNIIQVPLPSQWSGTMQPAPSSRHTKKERKNAIPIIDPETSKEVNAYDDTNADSIKSPNDAESSKDNERDTAMKTKAEFAEQVSRLAIETPSFEPGMHSHPMMPKELTHGLPNGSESFDMYANEWKTSCDVLDHPPQIATSIIMNIPSEPEHKSTPVVSANINSPPVRLQFSHREYTPTEPPVSANSQPSAPSIIPSRVDADDNVYNTSSAKSIIIPNASISTAFPSNVTSVTTADITNKDIAPVVQPSVLAEDVPHQKIVNILQKPSLALPVHQSKTPPITSDIGKKEEIPAPAVPTPVPSITSFPTCLPPIPPTQTTNMQQPPFPQPFPSKSASVISKNKPPSMEQNAPPQRTNEKSQPKEKKEKSRQKEIHPSSVDAQPLNTKVKGSSGNQAHAKSATDTSKAASNLSKQLNGENSSDSSSFTEGKPARKSKAPKGKKDKDAGNKKSAEKESAENTLEAFCDIKQTQNANSNTRSLNNNNNNNINVHSNNNNCNNNNNNNNNNNKISKTNSSQKTVERNQKPLEEEDKLIKNEENIRKTGEIKTTELTKSSSVEPKKSNDKETAELLSINNYCEINEQVIPKINANKAAQSFVHGDVGQTTTIPMKRKYDLDALKSIGKNPECQKKLPFLEVASTLCLLRDQHNPISSRNSSSHGSNNMLYPNFGGNAGPRNSAPITTRKSQQGSLKRDNKPHNAPLIHMSLSLREEVQLRQSKNAWKPARFDATRDLTDDDKKTKELYKVVTGILNKLTPQKFDKLVSKIQSLNIDTESRLQGVIDLIFSKACDEPGFCQTYAQMCKVLQELQVGTTDPNDKKKGTFRYLIITKCQAEFESETAQTLDMNKRQKEIDTCTDPEKKKELQIQLEEDERKFRRKSVGNCRFIGELFKLGMLTARIMWHCVNDLVDKVFEESLECMCKLLQIIGKDLEASNDGSKLMDDIFKKMQALTEKKNANVPSRIRFMLLDVIDLRKTNWIPRRDENKPKTIAEINEDINKQEQESRYLSMAPLPIKKNDSFSRENRRGAQGNGEWTTVGNHKNQQRNNASLPYSYDRGKLDSLVSTRMPQNEVQLGSSNQFTSWGSGASRGNQPTQRGYNNAYGMQDAQRSMQQMQNLGYRGGPGGKVTQTPSMERNSFSFRTDGHDNNKISRTGSLQQPPSRDSSLSYRQSQVPPRLSQTSQPPPPSLPPVHVPPPPTIPSEPTMPTILNDDALKTQSIMLYQEYLSHSKISESILCTKRIDESQLGKMVSHIVDFVIEKKYEMKEACGQLLQGLCKVNALSGEHIVSGLQGICEYSAEFIIDMPKLWDDVATIIGYLFEDGIEFTYIKDFFANIPDNESKLEFFVALMNRLKKSKGKEEWVREQWAKSKLNLQHFVPADEINKFAKKLGSDYPSWLESTGATLVDSNATDQYATVDLVEKLLSLLKTTENAFEDVPLWIKNNVPNMDRPNLIYVLTLAIFRAVLNGENNTYQICDELPQQYRKLLTIYLDGHNEQDEIQCIYAAEKLSTQLEHPAGLLLQMFKVLVQNSLVSCETFGKWQNETSKDKGVILYSGGVKEFLLSLATSDSES